MTSKICITVGNQLLGTVSHCSTKYLSSKILQNNHNQIINYQ